MRKTSQPSGTLTGNVFKVAPEAIARKQCTHFARHSNGVTGVRREVGSEHRHTRVRAKVWEAVT